MIRFDILLFRFTMISLISYCLCCRFLDLMKTILKMSCYVYASGSSLSLAQAASTRSVYNNNKYH
jgi:hypothetical protein